MELSIRDWMVIVGVLLIVAVLLDGFRRIRNDRRNSIRMSLNKQFLNSSGSDEFFTSELPSGGARVVDRSGNGGNIDLGSSKVPYNGHVDELAEDDDLYLDDPIDQVAHQYDEDYHEPADELESGFSAADDYEFEQPSKSKNSYDRENREIELEYADEIDELVAEAKEMADTVAAITDTHIDADAIDAQAANESAEQPVSYAATTAASTPAAYTEDAEVIVIKVMSREPEGFQGPDLLHILLACDMRYGEMNILHRYEKSNGQGAVQFSVANLVEPGTFDLDNINDFSTPGVCFFINLPGPDDAVQAFECMVETAQVLVKNLGAELRDESHSAMTNQTLEHYRQHIIDRERQQLTQHA